MGVVLHLAATRTARHRTTTIQSRARGGPGLIDNDLKSDTQDQPNNVRLPIMNLEHLILWWACKDQNDLLPVWLSDAVISRLA